MSRPSIDLSLYLVTDTVMSAGRGVAQTVRAAVDGGVTVVQLRDHHATDAEFVALGREVAEVLRGTGVPLLVDDRVHLARSIGADGAHVGQRDMPVGEARSALGPDALLGLSASTEEQVRAAAHLPLGSVDYLGIGPVWATTTKADHGPTLGPGGLRELVGMATLPAVAIGGIDASRVPELAGCGADGIAVVSAICAASDPGQAARQLGAAWQAIQ